MVAFLSLKNAWLPTCLFVDSNYPCYNLLFPYSHNICKNTSVLGGTVLNNRNIIMNSQKTKCPRHHPRLFLTRTKISGVLMAAHLNTIIIILNHMVSYIYCTLNIVFIFIFSPPQEQP